MSILTLLNAKPTPKVKTKRAQPTPTSIGLPRFNKIASWVKFVHPPIGDQAQPEGRGKSVPATCEYATPDMPMDSIGCKSQPEARYVFVEGSGYQLAEPAPEPVVERPTKSEYIAAFQDEAYLTDKPLPECVRFTWLSSNATVDDFCETYDAFPRRGQRALDRYNPTDLACAYDRGLLGRIEYYCKHSQKRFYRPKNFATTT